METLNKALKISPNDEELHFLLGVIYDKDGNTKASIEKMKGVLKLNPSHAGALNYIGYTYADKGINLKEAEKFIKKALSIKPKDGYITDSLGWVYYKLGRINEAITELEKAVNLAPKDPLIIEHLGDAYSKLNILDKALEMYLRASELDPNKKELLRKIEEIKSKGNP
jgi:Flp pilus assembly protein TadD